MGRGTFCRWILAAACVSAQAAEVGILDLIKTVRTGIAQKTSDKALARSIHGLTLRERLDLRTIEELESEGAGPESVNALELLYENSSTKPVSEELPPFTSPPRPSVEEQKEFFHRLDQNAIHYTRGLPDFICNEIVHRYQMTPKAPAGYGSRRASMPPSLGQGAWLSKDVLTVKLTYFENHEKYELTLVNGHKTRDSYESAGGAVSEGDFGTVLLELFDPDTATKFQWAHWTHLRKRLTRVYAFSTSRQTSHYRIGVGNNPAIRSVVTTGRRGFVYADDETGMVMRIASEADDIPRSFPVTAQSTMVDYSYADVGGKPYLLPLRVNNRMYTARLNFKNILEFRDYRKFTGESTITFDAPADTSTDPGKK